MKRLLTSALLALTLGGCNAFDKYAKEDFSLTPRHSSATSYDPLIATYLPAGERLISTDYEEVDVDEDGNPDARVITIDTSGKNLQRRIQIIHGYKDGELLEHPYSVIDFAENINEKNGLGTLNEYYDYGTKKLEIKNPRLKDFMYSVPDGIMDHHKETENFPKEKLYPPEIMELRPPQKLPQQSPSPQPLPQQRKIPKSKIKVA